MGKRNGLGLGGILGSCSCVSTPGMPSRIPNTDSPASLHHRLPSSQSSLHSVTSPLSKFRIMVISQTRSQPLVYRRKCNVAVQFKWCLGESTLYTSLMVPYEQPSPGIMSSVVGEQPRQRGLPRLLFLSPSLFISKAATNLGEMLEIPWTPLLHICNNNGKVTFFFFLSASHVIGIGLRALRSARDLP